MKRFVNRLLARATTCGSGIDATVPSAAMAAHDIESIEVDRTKHVFIEFSDGVTATFDLAPLRLACPCAECNSRRQKGTSVSIMAETQPDEVAITEAAMAGNWGHRCFCDRHLVGLGLGHDRHRRALLAP